MPDITQIRQVIELLAGRFQSNFECDSFANKFQQALQNHEIEHQGKTLAFRRADTRHSHRKRVKL